MNSINMLKERRLSAKMGSTLNESGYERRKQFSCYFPDSSENHNADIYLEDENMFYEPQAEKEWQCKFCCDILLSSPMSDQKILHFIFIILIFCSEQRSI